MHLLDLTLDLPTANLALDEALLDEAEAAGDARETLRLWEPAAPLVVIGRSSKPDAEVRLDFCREHQIPVLRRASGGAAIVTGPGCLMYALVLSRESRPVLRSLDEAHRFVLETMARALNTVVPEIYRQGTSDLAMGRTQPKKFSGNSVRIKRHHILYHGTLLYNFQLDIIADCLALAPRQPVYRAGRDHGAFVANLPIAAEALRDTVASRAWQTDTPRTNWPQARVHELVAGKYQTPEWTIEV